jgi:hypothetical protein
MAEVQAEEITFDAGERRLSGLWTPASTRKPVAVAVVAHGAGSTMRHQYLDGIVDGLTGDAVAALRFNFPYAETGRRYPDPAPILMAAWRAALAEAARRARGLPIAASGKSLGGRIAWYRQPVELVLGPAVFDRDVLAFDIAGVLQALAKCAHAVGTSVG